jgi:predicted N-formylglutamate amidohydrolase
VAAQRRDGTSPFVLACDHAGNRIPRRLDRLGLDLPHLERHIAWDIGAAEVARDLSQRLGAALVMQRYSRLVIDCNRSRDAPDSITAHSEDTRIPGNHCMDEAAAEQRAREIFHPYHDRIAGMLDSRQAAGRPSILVSVHSFTPIYLGEKRPWHLGVLYNRDRRLADPLIELLARSDDLCIGNNQPYAVNDESDYTIPVHAERRGIPCVEFEIRQDLIATASGQSEWAARLSDLLNQALEKMPAFVYSP